MKKITLMLTVAFVLLSLHSEAKADIGMYLSPSSQTVGIGSTFDLEVGLSNPDSLAFDTLSFWITFDSTKLAVQDTDSGNWITTGTNVLDGSYHSTYPFNVHFQNSADNALGEIVYNEGILPSTLSSSGTFAKITFLALGPTPSTPIDFNFNWGQLKDTYVVNGGVDVLGSSSGHTDGATGANVSIIPEPASLTLLAFGLGALGRLKKRYVKGREK